MPISTINQAGLNAPLTLTAPVLGTPASINLTNATALPSAALPAGSVLQVVNATTTTETSNATSTYADTTLTASITPKFATSKILVIVNQQGCQKRPTNTLSGLSLRLLRNSTDLITFQRYGGYTDTNSFNYFSAVGGNYLDSPATTSSVTYKTQFMNESNADSVRVQGVSSASTITLMEIAQ